MSRPTEPEPDSLPSRNPRSRKITFRPLLALVLLFGLAIAAPARAAVFDPVTFTLDNGMQVVVLENHRAPIVTHMVYYRVGAADEPRGVSGIAHFLEHLMFKGTPDVPAGEFSRRVRAVGGYDNAFTTQDYTGYYQTVPAAALDLVMRMEADRMRNLELTDDVVGPERDVILEERRVRIDNSARALFGEQVGAALYQNHPYGTPTIGWRHEMKQLDRDDAITFYNRFYRPNNAILVVAGDVTAEQVRTLAERYYGPLEPGGVPSRDWTIEPPHLAPVRVEMTREDVGDTVFGRSYLAPSYVYGESGEAYALQFLARILGGSTGRLYQALAVEQRLASSISAYYSPSDRGPATFSIYASPLPGTDPATLETAIDAEIAKLLRDGVTDEEVERARTRLESAAVFARDDLSGAARTLGEALAIGRSVDDVESWPERIAAVTKDDVEAAADHVLHIERSVTGVLRPTSTQETSQ
jgi:zinc protease